MERKQIQFTRQQMAALRREARRRRTSEASIVREAVDSWMRSQGPAARAELVRRALSVVGKFSSGGGRNIATEHDRELGDVLYQEIRAKR